MPSFLEKLAVKLTTEHPDNLHEICVVLPNRRARVFLKDALQRNIHEPVWMPKVFGMEDFIATLSGKTILSTFSLLFELFQVRKQIDKSQRTIDEFLQWGAIMLGDFNEIDLYKIDADVLFDNLSDAKAIEKWHPGEELSDMEKNYLRFFSSLKTYYHALNDRLEEKNEAYQGAAFRFVAENIEKLSADMPWKKVLFAGFNALSNTEKRIISCLEKMGRAESLFDADSYYLDDEKQEAGIFLRKLKERYAKSGFNWISEGFSQPKNINIVRAAGKITMAKAVTRILEEIPSDDRPADTALVLVDEDLLIPVISAIPEKAGKYNVTMGYAFADTAAAELIVALLELYANAEHNRLSHNRDTYFYRYLVNVLQHPYINHLVGFDDAGIRSVIDMVVKRNRVMYSCYELQELYDGSDVALDMIPGEAPTTPQDTINKILTVFNAIHNALYEGGLDDGSKKFEYEFVCQGILFLNKMNELAVEFDDIENIRILKVVATQMIREVSVPFVGEPLSGLQVMGMLETRTLDFKNVIMLSVNEGTLPKAKSYNSLIPYDLRKSFGIPSYREKNAVFAYHFYRLLQQAENVWCLYDTQSEKMGKGEPSRFLLQLQQELPEYNPNIDIDVFDVQDADIPKVGEGLLRVEKTGGVLESLHALSQKGLSPTALNTYKNCQVKFFLSHVMRIGEIEEVEESVDARIFGNVVHKALEKLYSPYKNIALTVTDCDSMAAKAREMLEISFENEYEGSVDEGHNLLAFKAGLSYIHRMLKYEKQRVEQGDEIIVTYLEENLRVERKINLDNGDDVFVLFRGFADRVEQWNKVVSVIDYKTGRVDSTQKKFSPQLVIDDIKGKYKIEFQLLMYSWLYSTQFASTSVPQSGAWALRYVKDPIKMVKLDENDDPAEVMQLFGEYLENLMREIFDTETPFSRTDDSSHCKYCPYAASICLR